MTKETMQEIMDAQKRDHKKGSIREGLNILAKYDPEVDIECAEHDEVFASTSIDKLIECNIHEIDIILLAKLGWFISDDYNSLKHFV